MKGTHLHIYVLCFVVNFWSNGGKMQALQSCLAPLPLIGMASMAMSNKQKHVPNLTNDIHVLVVVVVVAPRL